MQVETQQLRNFLLDANLVSNDQFNECVKLASEANQKIDDVLVSRGIVSAEELTKLKAYILGIPYVNLEKEFIPQQVLQLIPEPIAKANNIISFRKTGPVLEVAMLDPEDLQIIEFIKKTTGTNVVPRLTNATSIKNALVQYQKTLQAEFGELGVSKEEKSITDKSEPKSLKSIKMTSEGETAAENQEGKEELKKVAEEVPVIRVVDTLIKHAVIQRASDIHIEPTERELLVRYLID